jgi:outer membrane protein assembly factor BamB
MPFDRAFEPIVHGRTMLLGFNDTDKLVALDTRTGRELWRFYADGPVRLPPVAWGGRVYFVSDDGWLYCLDIASGRCRWRRRGGPSARRCLGNRRLISSWPARGGPVVAEGVVYWAASIWPFMGTFVYATDATTGEEIWCNDATGGLLTVQPHWSPAFGGVAPQGALACLGDRLLVPGGRSVPACFDRETGRFLYYHLANNGWSGSSQIAATGTHFLNSGRIFEVATGKSVSFADSGGAMTADTFYCRGNPITALSADPKRWTVTVRRTVRRPRTTVRYVRNPLTGKFLKKALVEDLYDETTTTTEPGRPPTVTEERWATVTDSYTEPLEPGEKPSARPVVTFEDAVTYTLTRRKLEQRWQCDVEGRRALIRAGNRLYCGEEGSISALKLPPDGGMPTLEWVKAVDGTVVGLLAADDRLFAVTLEGRIYCFGGREGQPTLHALQPPTREAMPLGKQQAASAEAVLAASGARGGYGVVFGVGDGTLLEALARRSELHVIGIDPDAAKIDRLRRRLDEVGLYGQRVHLLAGMPQTAALPPYMASLVVVPDPQAAGMEAGAAFIRQLFEPLRPYGGTAVLMLGAERHASFAKLVGGCGLAGAKVRRVGGLTLLSRVGALPGAGVWTHQYGDAANTLVSRDERVRLPLGILWFGGSSHEGILPRHGHGPPEQIIGGRLIIEGPDGLRAMDVYTGRVLWEADLPGLGKLYDSTRHQPGASAAGSNYVSTADAVYVAYRNACLRLDPATGKTVARFALPPAPGADQPPQWTYINVLGDYLIGGADAIQFDARKLPWRMRQDLKFIDYTLTHSKRLVVMNRHTGRVLWRTTAAYGFRHNAICLGAGKLFCLDRLTRPAILAMMRAGALPDVAPSLTAFDVKTGRRVWREEDRVFGTWLGYSAERDILLQASRPSRDMLGDEYLHDDRMATFRGADGKVLWDRMDLAYNGPPLLHGDTILAQESAYSLLTGRRRMRTDPRKGNRVPWKVRRNYGCNTMIASRHLLTFRSAAAGFYDLTHDGGTGNLGGFKSGCTSNLIAADGVLNAPDYTRTCKCSYQNQTSLALVHYPQGDVWTDLSFEVDPFAVNFGAPGGRRATDGTAWGPWPKLRQYKQRQWEPREPDHRLRVEYDERFGYWARHPSRFVAPADTGAPRWVASSGIRGVRKIVLAPGRAKGTSWVVCLHFAEPDNIPAGRRVFDVTLQGRTVLKGFDIVRAAGGPRRAVVRTFPGVKADGGIVLTFDPRGSGEADATRVPVLSGITVRAGS